MQIHQVLCFHEAADVTFGDTWTYFTNKTYTTGRELWKTDGTPQGTSLVVDLAPGTPDSSIRNLTVVGDIAYFICA